MTPCAAAAAAASVSASASVAVALHISKNLHDIEMPMADAIRAADCVRLAGWSTHQSQHQHSQIPGHEEIGSLRCQERVAATSLDTDFLSLIKLKHVSYRVHRYQAYLAAVSLPGPQGPSRLISPSFCCGCGCGTRLIADMQSPSTWPPPPTPAATSADARGTQSAAERLYL